MTSKTTLKYNGKPVTKAELDALMPPKSDWLDSPPMTANTYSEHDPLLSDGCGVMKAQVQEAREAIRQHNIPGAAVHDDGKVQFTSRRARRDFLKMRGLHDQDGGYSD